MQCKYQNRPGKFHECYHPLTLSGYSCILDEGKECSLYEEDLEDLVRIRPSDRVKLQNILDFCELEGRGPLIGLDVLRRIVGEPLAYPKILLNEDNLLDFGPCNYCGRGDIIGHDEKDASCNNCNLGEIEVNNIKHEHDWCNMAPNNHMTCSICGKVYK